MNNLDIFGLSGCYIAGGAVLSVATKQPITDYDIYPKTKKDMVGLCKSLLSEAELIGFSENAVTFSHFNMKNYEGERVKVQIVRGEYPTPESIFESFDFSVCMGAFDCDSKTYTYHEDFWPDAASRTIRFNPNTRYPLASFVRTKKYNSKGYKISQGELAKMALAMGRKGEPSSWEELESAIGGAYGRTLKLSRGDEKYSFKKAIELLSGISDDSFEPVQLPLGITENLVDILEFVEGEVVYPVPPSLAYGIKDQYLRVDKYSFASILTISEDLSELLPPYDINPLEDLMYIKAWKQLKLKDDVLIGGIWYGSHNGVTYKLYEETRYETGCNLFCYLDSNQVVPGENTYIAEVVVPIKDIVGISPHKVQTKSMQCVSINPYPKSLNDLNFPL